MLRVHNLTVVKEMYITSKYIIYLSHPIRRQFLTKLLQKKKKSVSESKALLAYLGILLVYI